MNGVNPVNGFDYFGAGAPKQAKSELDMQTFMRLLTVQLANQNPLEPMNDRDFFAQMAQLGQVQGLDSMKNSLEVSQATSLIGRTVTAVRTMQEGSQGGSSLVTGTVTRMLVRDGQRIVTIEDAAGEKVDVRLGNIREVNQ